MKHTLLIILVCCLAYAGCRKSKQPAANYGVYGLQTVNIVNDGFGIGGLPLTVKYEGNYSGKPELITLSVSGLPEGITMDPTWVSSGYPPFDTRLMLYDTTAERAYPGTYALTLTTESSISGRRDLLFNLVVSSPPVCTGKLVGLYNFCYSYFNWTAYRDSVYDDPRISNRIWFTNFNNTGHKLFADMNCTTDYLQIQPQTIGSVTYSGGGVCKNENQMSLTITAKTVYKSTIAVINLN